MNVRILSKPMRMAERMEEEQPCRPQAPIWDAVVSDMKARDDFGKAKYGKELDINDKRDWLDEAYAEALDQCVYLKAAIMKRDADARNTQ